LHICTRQCNQLLWIHARKRCNAQSIAQLPFQPLGFGQFGLGQSGFGQSGFGQSGFG